ncbi:alpha/beta hydrolase [Erysipelothrix sp. HDW6C]|uniref:alpha/beta fold hydrolase n=1 Tax=Erysipelothrix sp. HDW6C TaxID=2714930 RepID=UPI0014092EA0|nr:alpha/beta hydrolase [Erysipelothrix sp. HDW6C]QIK70354.1 alpha/beta hydrolase [Erysipelothrix sp. HDW6C]
MIDTIKVRGQHNQTLVTYATNKEHPIIFYIHGGPGDSCAPLIERFNQQLAKSFTLIVWEQRGAGLSYYKFAEDEVPTIQDYVDDAKVLIEYILDKYGRDKLYVIGHSWGSVIGIKCLQQFPDYIQAYIGCGQVVNMQETLINQVRFISDRSMTDDEVAHKAQIDFTQSDWLKQVLTITRDVVKRGGSLYGRTNQNYLVKPFLFSKIYSIRDLVNRQKGSKQSIIKLWQELMTVDFSDVVQLDVPVHLVAGAHDEHVSTQIAKSWFTNLTSEKSLTIFEHSAHFPQWEEAKRFNDYVVQCFK